jgi:WD40 repeat protein
MIQKKLFVFLIFISLRSSAQEPKLVLPIGHTGQLLYAAFSPNGQFAVTASADHTAKIWDINTGEDIITLKHRLDVMSANYSPDGKLIVTASVSGWVAIWNASDGSLLLNFKAHHDWVTFASFSPDGKKIVTASRDSTAKIWEASTGKLLVSLKGHTSYVSSAFFSPDGNTIVTASHDNTSILWNASDGKILSILKGHRDWVNFASFSPDGKYVVSASDDSTIRIWNVSKGSFISEMHEHPDYMNSAMFSPDGKKIITASSDSKARIWDVQTKKMLIELKGHSNRVESACFSKDGKSILTSSWDNTAILWNEADGKIISRLSGHTTAMHDATYSPDGKMMATGSEDNIIRIWKVKDGKMMFELKGHTDFITSLHFSPDGKKLLSSSADNTAKIWDLSTRKITTDLNKHTNMIVTANFSNDGKRVVTASWDFTTKLWDAYTGELLKEFKEDKPDSIDLPFRHAIESAAFSMDGSKIVTGSLDGLVRIWDIESGHLILKFNSNSYNVNDVCYSPDGKKILTASEYDADLWDAVTGKLITPFKGHRMRIQSAEFSPDGKKIITASQDHTAIIWNVATGKPLDTLYHDAGVISARFSSNGDFILTSSLDKTVKVWESSTAKHIYTFFPLDSNDYLIQIPSGYYLCTPGASKRLSYKLGEQRISFDQLDIKYNRPDIVEAEIGKAFGETDSLLIKSYKNAYQKRIRKLGIDTSLFSSSYSIPEGGFRQVPAYNQQNQKLKIHIWASDSSYILDRLNVWINDSPVWGQKGITLRKSKKNSFDTIIEITLSDGPNRIETSAMNVNGTESYRHRIYVNYLARKESVVTTYFIGIGIDHFADSRHNLMWSTKDIRDMSGAMKIKYGKHLIIDTLFNQQVTIENVCAIRKLLKNTTVNDRVIIAYSGHGLLSSNFDYYLSTYNVNFDKPEQGGLAYEELENLVDSIPARKKLMMIDACHSGEVDKEEMKRIASVSNDTSLHLSYAKGPLLLFDSNSMNTGVTNSFELMNDLFINVSKGTGATVIAASAGTQFALENNELQNGVFTFCLLQMMNSRETCSVQELKAIISTEVERRTNGAQKPTSRSETSNFDWQIW